MIQESLLTRLLMTRPFVPFAIHLASGKGWDFNDTDDVWTGGGLLMFRSTQSDHLHLVSLDHIVSIEVFGNWDPDQGDWLKEMLP